jgi:hypothetical protein
MTAEDLLKLICQRPFIPFVIVTRDGTRYEIRRPQFVMPLRQHVIIGMPANPEDEIADITVHLLLEQVQRLEIGEGDGKVVDG